MGEWWALKAMLPWKGGIIMVRLWPWRVPLRRATTSQPLQARCLKGPRALGTLNSTDTVRSANRNDARN